MQISSVNILAIKQISKKCRDSFYWEWRNGFYGCILRNGEGRKRGRGRENKHFNRKLNKVSLR